MSARIATLLKTLTGVKYGGIKQLHDLLVDLLSKWLRRAKIPHMGGVGGFKRTCKWLFTEFAKQLPELDPDSLLMPGPCGTDRAPPPISCMTLGRSTSPRL